MIIKISTRAVDTLLATRFPIDHPDLAEALIHPINLQLNGFARLATVNMQTDDWWIVEDGLRHISTIEPGDSARHEHEALTAQRASSAINTAMTRLASHPAYHARGIAGISAVALPAYWYTDEHLFPSRRQALIDSLRRGGPETVTCHEGLLHPRIRTVRARRFTVWELVPRHMISAASGAQRDVPDANTRNDSATIPDSDSKSS